MTRELVCLRNKIKPKLTILQNHEEEYSLHQAIENLNQNTRLTYINIYKNQQQFETALQIFNDIKQFRNEAKYVFLSAFLSKHQNKEIQFDTERIQNNIYLGPSFSNDEIKSYLDTNNIEYKFLEREQLLETSAKLITESNVVGWFQGRMEWGPRALGNRSILADPRLSEMKDILNEKIKHRESFRPFAPSILEEYVSEYFELDVPSPYMLLVAKVKKPDKIPAVTHVDGTGRLQSVSKHVNPLYYDLINKFYEKTGVPVIINTSMNVMGEPIVNTPEQAHAMILKTDMDYLVMGNFILSK